MRVFIVNLFNKFQDLKYTIPHLILAFLIVSTQSIQAQVEVDQQDLVQLSGVVTYEEGGEILPLIGATISVKDTRRGTTAAIDGFFSLVVVRGETVQIRFLGYETIEIEITDNLKTYDSVILLMERDAQNLPMVEILPIPSKEFFEEDFLAMEVNDPFGERARENLSAGLMQEILETLPADGGESARVNLKQTAQSYYYTGQIKPQNIFNPLAWQKFIKAWKNGDFKKKDKKKKQY